MPEIAQGQFVIRKAEAADAATILSLIRELADYERARAEAKTGQDNPDGARDRVR